MKVLYILDYGTVGGATIAFVEMVKYLKNMGIEPFVVTGMRNDLNLTLENEGIQTFAAGHYTALEPLSKTKYYWPYSYIKLFIRYWIHEYLAIKKICKSIDFRDIDIIHTNSARNTIGCYLANKFHKPHVVHIREFADKDFGCVNLNPIYAKLLNKNSTRFISISIAVRDYWISKGLSNENNNLLVYDGVRYDDICVSNDESKQNDFLRLFIAGGVYPTKGQHLIIEAIGELPQDVQKNIFLDIAGWYSPMYVSKMKEYAEKRGFLKNINFLGKCNDIHKRLGNYQIGLTCSRAEGFGLVTAEYMHAQLGVIASNSGACPELIKDSYSGLLFECGNSKDLAEKILFMYNNRQKLIEFSHNAKIEAQNRFTYEINAEKIIKIYKEIIGENE